jgi:cell filamentation protein
VNPDAQAFASRAAHFLYELNAIHAFREGNGRSQLTFWFCSLTMQAPAQDRETDPTQMLAG